MRARYGKGKVIRNNPLKVGVVVLACIETEDEKIVFPRYYSLVNGRVNFQAKLKVNLPGCRALGCVYALSETKQPNVVKKVGEVKKANWTGEGQTKRAGFEFSKSVDDLTILNLFAQEVKAEDLCVYAVGDKVATGLDGTLYKKPILRKEFVDKRTPLPINKIKRVNKKKTNKNVKV